MSGDQANQVDQVHQVEQADQVVLLAQVDKDITLYQSFYPYVFLTHPTHQHIRRENANLLYKSGLGGRPLQSVS